MIPVDQCSEGKRVRLTINLNDGRSAGDTGVLTRWPSAPIGLDLWCVVFDRDCGTDRQNPIFCGFDIDSQSKELVFMVDICDLE